MHCVPEWWDWTQGPDGRSNTSPLKRMIEADVEQVIRTSAHDLILGRADNVASLIVARIAHIYQLVPSESTEHWRDDQNQLG